MKKILSSKEIDFYKSKISKVFEFWAEDTSKHILSKEKLQKELSENFKEAFFTGRIRFFQME